MKIARVTSDTRNFYLTYSAALQPHAAEVAAAVVRNLGVAADASGVNVTIVVVCVPTHSPDAGRDGLHGPLTYVTC